MMNSTKLRNYLRKVRFPNRISFQTQSKGRFRNCLSFLFNLSSYSSEEQVQMWKLPEIAPKKKRKYRKTELALKRKKSELGMIEYRYHIIPRIVKSDIRRQYGHMFANVYNSCDYNFMMDFFTKFVRMDGDFSIKRHDKSRELIETKRNIEACSRYWYDRMTDAPDVIFNILDSKFTLRSNGTSMVASSFHLCGTKSLYVAFATMLQMNEDFAKETISQVFENAMTSISTDKSHPIHQIVDLDLSQHDPNKLLLSVKYSFKGKIVLHIDPDSKIYRCELGIDWSTITLENLFAGMSLDGPQIQISAN